MKYTHEDGTPFTKKEFLQKLKTDKEFNDKFGCKGIDQISELIRSLKESPDSRRMVVNAWNPSDLEDQVLPPCHYSFQFYTRELSLEERFSIQIKINDYQSSYTHEQMDNNNIPRRAISLIYNARSQDLPLGTPFNIASYSLLLEIIAKTVNMVPDELIANMGDCHIYENQIEGIKEQLTREPYPLPTLKHLKTDEFYKSLGENFDLITHLDNTDFVIENYQSHPAIKIPLSN